jgi:hypothetical protein
MIRIKRCETTFRYVSLDGLHPTTLSMQTNPRTTRPRLALPNAENSHWRGKALSNLGPICRVRASAPPQAH